MGKLADCFLNHNVNWGKAPPNPSAHSVGDTGVLSLILVMLNLCKLPKLVLTENSCAGVKNKNKNTTTTKALRL